ncbi:MAG: chaperone modulator CbpM [Bacteroidota bacterium]
MQTQKLIALEEFCASHGIEISFITSLQQTGLIEVTRVNERGFIASDQLKNLEKIVSFHFDLEINLEGIETINHLLQRITSLQDEITGLSNRLRMYEPYDYSAPVSDSSTNSE